MDHSFVYFIGFVLSLGISGMIGILFGALRGRKTAGFWWGFCLGLFGWLLVLCLKDLRPRCPYCNGVITSDWINTCQHCAKTISIEGAKDQLAQCPKCHCRFLWNHAAIVRGECPRCGMAFR